VWHASVASIKTPLQPQVAVALAEAALHGVGNAGRGQWVEVTRVAAHVRRRLSETEELVVGPVVDVRGTPEAQRRYDACAPQLSVRSLTLASAELAGVAPGRAEP
jgi:hypothetical protein